MVIQVQDQPLEYNAIQTTGSLQSVQQDPSIEGVESGWQIKQGQYRQISTVKAVSVQSTFSTSVLCCGVLSMLTVDQATAYMRQDVITAVLATRCSYTFNSTYMFTEIYRKISMMYHETNLFNNNS